LLTKICLNWKLLYRGSKKMMPEKYYVFLSGESGYELG